MGSLIRMGSLRRLFAAAVFVGSAAAPLSPGAAADLAMPVAPDSSALVAAFAVHDAVVEESFDAATLAALDQLLLEPVELNRGVLTPLLSLPWLGAAQLESLRRARPLASLESLARLPGWDAELVERLRPFVHLASAGASWRTQVQTLVAPQRREIWLRAESAHLHGGLRSAPEAQALSAGYLALEAPHFEIVVGDFRLAHAQGLLWWSSAADVAATAAPLRRGRGALGTEAATSSRGLRGAAATLHLAAMRLVVAQGQGEGERRTGALARLGLGHGHGLSAGWLASGGRQWTSFGWSVAGGRTQIEAEVAPCAEAWAVAIAGEKRWPRARLAARWQATPPGGLAPLAGVTARTARAESRQALLQAAVRWGGARWELALGRAAWRDSLASERQSFEQRLAALWQFEAQSLELRLRQRRVRTAALDIEAPAPLATERDRSLVLRLVRRLDHRTSLALDYRAAENAAARELATGSAWQVHLEHRRGALRLQAALTGFTAPSGVAAPTVPEPGIGAGFGSRRLHGDGLRSAIALRLQTAVFSWGARCGRSFGASAPERLDWALLGGLQIP